jgi:hypothetical protein
VTVADGEDFASVNACHDELEVVTIFGEAESALNDRADLEGQVGGVNVEGGGVVIHHGLRGGKASGGEHEGEGTEDCGCAGA